MGHCLNRMSLRKLEDYVAQLSKSGRSFKDYAEVAGDFFRVHNVSATRSNIEGACRAMGVHLNFAGRVTGGALFGAAAAQHANGVVNQRLKNIEDRLSQLEQRQ